MTDIPFADAVRTCLTALFPVVGPIIFLVGMTVDGTSGANRYGPSPKPVGHPVG
ncbi:DUF805 domain-containing protein [Streptomyces sp. SID12488]|uniref:DUF805 domain-containing protein n=1 Tax=Streptomyces sp. SID12488 TaxID=2706040 RepID=UPI0013D98316|nr:DUF805 domain-containing protein [Streptomyces sp. SID12488]NEA63371.1 DUF805 domain-containing protein [Streptomyces sp. SID12488]